MSLTYVLPFKIQDQQGKNWCWVANAASVSYFYEGVRGKTQCQIACKTFLRNDCCQSPTPCDAEGNLKNALCITGNLTGPLNAGPMNANDISNQINAGCVIGVMIVWPNLFAHFVTIYGYDGSTGTDYVMVADPQNPRYVYTFYDLLNNYAGVGGKWQQSYFTIKHPPLTNQLSLMRKSLVLPATKINTTSEKQKAIVRSSKVPLKKARLHAHDINYIVFENLLQGHLTYKKIGFRILKRGKKAYLADFSDEEHKLIGLTDDDVYIALYSKKWEQVKDEIRKEKKAYSIQILQVPQIGVECFKLEFTGVDRAEFLPIRNSFLFEGEDFYSEEQLLQVLTAAAKKKVEAMK